MQEGADRSRRRLDKAEEILRIKLGNKASKAAARVAAEGVVAAYVAADGKLGAMVEVNCETDFVAKNEDFLAFADSLAELVATNNPADVAALVGLPLDGASVEERAQALVGKIGENMSIRRFARMQAKGKLATLPARRPKIGVLVDFDGGDEALGKDVAMHIAASKPVALSTRAGVRRARPERTRHRCGESGRIGQARRRSSRRWSKARAEIPEGSHAARPAVREETTSRPSSRC